MSVTACWPEKHINHETKKRTPQDSMRRVWRKMEKDVRLGFATKMSKKVELRKHI